MNKGDNKVLDVFQNKCLRQILRIRWEEHVTTEELHENADTKPLSVEVKRQKWKMIGHILRQDRNNHSNIAMTWAPEGKRKKGRPKTTWRHTVEKERREAGWSSWEEARVTDRNKWRNSVEALCGNIKRPPLLSGQLLKSRNYCQYNTVNKTLFKRPPLLTLYPLRRMAVFPKSVNTDSLPVYYYNVPFKSY